MDNNKIKGIWFNPRFDMSNWIKRTISIIKY
jgi:hypothetical protein